MQPRRRRGRKPSNLSAEEKRRRRLERGRVAANKCRQKKRELETEESELGRTEAQPFDQVAASVAAAKADQDSTIPVSNASATTTAAQFLDDAQYFITSPP